MQSTGKTMSAKFVILTRIPFVRRGAFFASLLCVALLAGPSSALAAVPIGVFSLGNSGKSVPNSVLNDPNVTGISIRYGWRDIEPAEGTFVWDWLDGEVARATAAGKQVLLRIMTQSAKPLWVTRAVRNNGGEFFTWDEHGDTSSIPVFWDPTYLEKKKNMIAALGAHFSSNPTITIVTTSFANAESEDWNVPHTPELVDEWISLGYTSEALIDAGQQIINATMEAFPHQYVVLSVGCNGSSLDPTPDYVARQTVFWGWDTWPGRFITQVSSLSTVIPPAPGNKYSSWALLGQMAPWAGAQMVFRCINDPEYRVNGGVPIDPPLALIAATDAGLAYNVKYIEIYEIDVVNMPTVIKQVQASLLGL